MKHRKWYRISIQLNEPYQDLLIGQLIHLGFSGFTQEKKSINCYILTSKWTITIRKEFRTILVRFKHEFPGVNLLFTITSIREENWNRTWEKHTGIIKASSQIVIKPSWKKLPANYGNKLVLHIDPKMSFGTGHHETTRLCLRLIERFLQPKMKVLDFGCGTGILGIACMKMGAQSVIAIDNDEWAIKNTRENVQRNCVKRGVKVLLGSVSAIPRQKYDFIIANIDLPTISKFIKPIASRTRKQGIIIISGLLTSDIPALLPLLRKNSLVPVELDDENDWIAVSLLRL